MRKKFHVTFIGKPSISKTQIKHLRTDTFVTFSDGCSGGGFSKQKLKYGSFNTNPILKQPPFGKKGKIKMKNGSVIYYVSDHARYKKAEGKSLDNVSLDPQWISDLSSLTFWVKRAKAMIKQGDHEKALTRIKQALETFKQLEISLRYRDLNANI